MKYFSITKHRAKSSKAFPPRMIIEATTTTTPGAGRDSIRLIGFDDDDGYRRYSIDLSPDLVALIAKVHAMNEDDRRGAEGGAT